MKRWDVSDWVFFMFALTACLVFLIGALRGTSGTDHSSGCRLEIFPPVSPAQSQDAGIQ